MKPTEPCGWKYNINFIPFQENVKFGRAAGFSFLAKISQEKRREQKEKKKNCFPAFLRFLPTYIAPEDIATAAKQVRTAKTAKHCRREQCRYGRGKDRKREKYI